MSIQFKEETLEIDEAVMTTTTGAVKLVYTSNMNLSATNKNSKMVSRLGHYLPNFVSSSGYWLLKFLLEKNTEGVTGDETMAVDISTGADGKKRVGFSSSPAKQPRVESRALRKEPSQAIPLTKVMVRALFDEKNVAIVSEVMEKAEELHADDMAKDKKTVRSIFVKLGYVSATINGKLQQLDYGIVITNYSIMRNKWSEEATQFPGGPAMLAQIVIRDSTASDKVPPMLLFSCTTDELRDITAHKGMRDLVAYNNEVVGDPEADTDVSESDEEEEDGADDHAKDEHTLRLQSVN